MWNLERLLHYRQLVKFNDEYLERKPPVSRPTVVGGDKSQHWIKLGEVPDYIPESLMLGGNVWRNSKTDREVTVQQDATHELGKLAVKHANGRVTHPRRHNFLKRHVKLPPPTGAEVIPDTLTSLDLKLNMQGTSHQLAVSLRNIADEIERLARKQELPLPWEGKCNSSCGHRYDYTVTT